MGPSRQCREGAWPLAILTPKCSGSILCIVVYTGVDPLGWFRTTPAAQFAHFKPLRVSPLFLLLLLRGPHGARDQVYGD